MGKKKFLGIMLTLLLTCIFVISSIEIVKATSVVHFYCTAISRGNYGSITFGFGGPTFQSGQSASYSESDYW